MKVWVVVHEFGDWDIDHTVRAVATTEAIATAIANSVEITRGPRGGRLTERHQLGKCCEIDEYDVVEQPPT